MRLLFKVSTPFFRLPLSAPPSSPQLLLQAVRSYLHFSQVRSWQEVVGGRDHTPFPFQLLYRVCAPGDSHNDFTPFPAHRHTFPSVPLTPNAFLVVTVATLPRLPHIPEQLSPPSLTCDHSSNSTTDNSNSITDKNSSHCQSSNEQARRKAKYLTSAPVPLGIGRLAKESPKEGFPFSPPLPSPLSPKLLMGLADRPTFSPSDSSDKGVSSLERTMRTVDLKSGPTPTPRDGKSSSNGGGGAVPPSACSPAPFSRMHTNRERDCVKRRSCAISCKVCMCVRM